MARSILNSAFPTGLYRSSCTVAQLATWALSPTMTALAIACVWSAFMFGSFAMIGGSVHSRLLHLRRKPIGIRVHQIDDIATVALVLSVGIPPLMRANRPRAGASLLIATVVSIALTWFYTA